MASPDGLGSSFGHQDPTASDSDDGDRGLIIGTCSRISGRGCTSLLRIRVPVPSLSPAGGRLCGVGPCQTVGEVRNDVPGHIPPAQVLCERPSWAVDSRLAVVSVTQ